MIDLQDTKTIGGSELDTDAKIEVPQDRAIIEHVELANALEKLSRLLFTEHREIVEKLDEQSKFINSDKYKKLPTEIQELLNEQRIHMNRYATTLSKRIEQFLTHHVVYPEDS